MNFQIYEFTRKLKLLDDFALSYSLPTIAYNKLSKTKYGIYINKENNEYFTGRALEYFHSDSNVFEVKIKKVDQFLNGKLHGISARYDSQGRLVNAEIYDEGYLTNKIVNDLYLKKVWHGGIQIRTVSLPTGYGFSGRYRFSGESLLFDDKENLRVMTSLSNGVKNGNEKILYESGKLKISRNYRDGILHGLWDLYAEDGDLLYGITFRTGYTDLNHSSVRGREEEYLFDFIALNILNIDNLNLYYFDDTLCEWTFKL